MDIRNSKEYSKENNNIWLAPVLINNKLVTVGGNKSLIISNPYNGKFEKTINLPGIPSTAPIIVKKKVFLMFKNSAIFSIE